MKKKDAGSASGVDAIVIEGIDFSCVSERRAKKCITHHYACDCREFNHSNMNTALKVIHTWAAFEIENGNENPFAVLKQIANKAAKALGRDDLIIR